MATAQPTQTQTATEQPEHVELKPQKKPVEKFRKDYAPPHYWIKNVDLTFHLIEGKSLVRSTLTCYRNAKSPPHCDLVLDGEDLELCELVVDGKAVTKGNGYTFNDEGQLVIDGKLLPAAAEQLFKVNSLVSVEPEKNLRLTGLYKSGGMYCTQCEAEGFRRITYFIDRPDVMSMYTVRIEADKDKFPILLSNGNKTKEGDLDNGRHFSEWADPWPKPCYLFALVAGDLGHIHDTFTTKSGRLVNLYIYSEKDNVDKLQWAMGSIQRSMKWDEEAYGREYDLDIFNVVAVNDFNMGAMENKSLNVFNTALVLALPETASDDDYQRIEGVIGHEYFHNWTGNRVTCRDWFQLTLKEGLTVFRDQCFSRAMGSAAVKRIEDIIVLRSRQFPEDAGPMQHQIRPESYIAMENFYTATVYDKGSEVIGMYHTLLGKEGFRKGTDLYFQRHDGQAVTCDDFRAAMADANGKDLTQFERWYLQAGTPELTVLSTKYDAAAKTFVIAFKQYTPPGPADPPGAVKLPFHIPIKVGLLDKATGAEIVPSTVLEMTEELQMFTFNNVTSEPIPSILRDFSAPVKLKFDCSNEDLAFLMANDTDSFNRWEAGQKIATRIIIDAMHQIEKGNDPLPLPIWFTDAFYKVIKAQGIDRSLQAYTMRLPDEKTLEEEVRPNPVDPAAINAARKYVRKHLAQSLHDQFLSTYTALSEEAKKETKYEVTAEAVARRRLRNTCLSYLCVSGDVNAAEMAYKQFVEANNMTDKTAAIVCLASMETELREKALQQFYDDAKGNPLVINKWFAFQAAADLPDTLERVKKLMSHPDFTFKNPNRLRSLLSVFANNGSKFHAKDGQGYKLLADTVLEVDKINPAISGRVATLLIGFKKYIPSLQSMMKTELQRIMDTPGLSPEVFEVVGKALKTDEKK
eukprot:GDKI01023909.1.p1 GENE.GDKI01023909.1~~GDKI01023909.1.p1  ORF type:complete len:959 (-),score=369.55 GDKI01023909.1:294-3038(-)